MGMFDGLDEVQGDATYYTDGDYVSELVNLKKDKTHKGHDRFVIETKVVDVIESFDRRKLTTPDGKDVWIEGSLRVGQTPARVINFDGYRDMALRDVKSFVQTLEQCLPVENRISQQEGETFESAIETYIANIDEIAGIRFMVNARNKDARITEGKSEKPFCKAKFIAIPPEDQPILQG